MGNDETPTFVKSTETTNGGGSTISTTSIKSSLGDGHVGNTESSDDIPSVLVTSSEPLFPHSRKPIKLGNYDQFRRSRTLIQCSLSGYNDIVFII